MISSQPSLSGRPFVRSREFVGPGLFEANISTSPFRRREKGTEGQEEPLGEPLKRSYTLLLAVADMKSSRGAGMPGGRPSAKPSHGYSHSKFYSLTGSSGGMFDSSAGQHLVHANVLIPASKLTLNSDFDPKVS